MISPTDLVVIVAVLVGMVGILVPVLPGLLLCWGAAVLWSLQTGGSAGWLVFGIASVAYAVGLVLQYTLPSRRLKAAGVGTRTLVVAALVGIVGFFVVPVVGLPLGFVGAIYLLERARLGRHGEAMTSTKVAVRSVGLSMGVELACATVILATVVVAALRVG